MVRFGSLFIFILTQGIAERIEFGNIPEVAKVFKIYKTLLQDISTVQDVHYELPKDELDFDDWMYNMMYMPFQ